MSRNGVEQEEGEDSEVGQIADTELGRAPAVLHRVSTIMVKFTLAQTHIFLLAPCKAF